MFKELTIAIFLGAIIGLGATLGYRNLTKKNNSTIISSSQVTPTQASQNDLTPSLPVNQHTLEITSPENEIVTSQSDLDIKGVTSPQSHLVIHTGSDSYFIEADDTGHFSQNIEIEAGINIIQISSFSKNEEKTETDLQITLSTADF